MLLNWISFELKPIWILFIWFCVFISHFKLNSGYRVRQVLRIKQTRSIKVLDCFPCQSFWIALLTTFNPVIAMAVYFMAVVTEKK